MAAKSELPEIVELFLKGGASPDALNKKLNSPLHFAALGGRPNCARVLIEHGAVTDSPLWANPLATAAVDGGNPELLTLLIEHKARFDQRDPYGAFPLHRASYNGMADIVEVLLDAGADPDARDFAYKTPAHVAAGGNHRDVVELLWKRGARMNASDVQASTPSQAAMRAGHSALAMHLKDLENRPVETADPAQSVKPEPTK
jgi:ankyrin repeat protein